jgi:hypothetical protein
MPELLLLESDLLLVLLQPLQLALLCEPVGVVSISSSMAPTVTVVVLAEEPVIRMKQTIIWFSGAEMPIRVVRRGLDMGKILIGVSRATASEGTSELPYIRHNFGLQTEILQLLFHRGNFLPSLFSLCKLLQKAMGRRKIASMMV